MKFTEITLGIMTSFGGFLDASDLVFVPAAGALYGYNMVWAILLSAIAIILFTEMSGRIVAVTGKPAMEAVKLKLSPKAALITFLSSNIVNLITVIAEIGAMAMIFRLLFYMPISLTIIFAMALIGGAIKILPFKWLERAFGLLGLVSIVFVIAAAKLHPDYGQILHNIIPRIPKTDNYLLYFYYAVGVFTTSLMAYEVSFYSSGGVEEKWKSEDVKTNAVISTIGMSFGSILDIALLVLGAIILLPRGITPEYLGTTALLSTTTLGRMGLYFTLTGMLFVISGAATEATLAFAYNFSQYFGYKWGVEKPAKEAKEFSAAWIMVLVAAILVMETGVDALKLVEYSVVLSALVLPPTYYAILKSAGDKKLLGKHANGKILNFLGWIFLGIVSLSAIAALPLYFLTHGGKG